MLIKWIVFGLPTIQRKIAVKTSDQIIVFRTRVVTPASLDHLFGLALPSLATFMRPAMVECGFPRVHKSFAHGVFAWRLAAGQRASDGGIDRPSTVWGVPKVFSVRVIAGFPAIEVRMADKAGDVVKAVGRRLVIEASLSKL